MTALDALSLLRARQILRHYREGLTVEQIARVMFPKATSRTPEAVISLVINNLIWLGNEQSVDCQGDV